jgi:hypothetical protein
MQPLPLPTDTLPLREALRGLRFLLRRGRDTVAHTLALEDLPEPASSLASVILREADEIARSVDSVASKAAKNVLGGQHSLSASLDQIVGQQGAEFVFAQAIYLALGKVLERLGAESVFVSEMAARSAFETWVREGRSGEPSDWLADLTLRLLEARVIRGVVAEKPGTVPTRDLDTLSIFAVLLWLQSRRSDDENEAALLSATDITQAKAAEVAAAVRTNSKERIAALYRKYVGHV